MRIGEMVIRFSNVEVVCDFDINGFSGVLGRKFEWSMFI